MNRKEDIRVSAAVALELSALVALFAAAYFWWQHKAHLTFLLVVVVVIAGGYSYFSMWDRLRKNERYAIGAAGLPVALFLVWTLNTWPYLTGAVSATFVVALAPAGAFILRTRAAEREEQAIDELLDQDCLIGDDALNAIAAAEMRIEIRRAAEQVGKGFERPVSGRDIKDAMARYLGHEVPQDELLRVLRYSLR